MQTNLISPSIVDTVLAISGAKTIEHCAEIQSLWSGYGQIVRLQLNGGAYPSVVLKHIRLPESGKHPRGWNTGLSHQRKVRSYRVETHWYQHYAPKCSNDCVVPSCLAVTASEDETVLVLTDLDAAGYSARKSSVDTHADMRHIRDCLGWLASFHATFLHSNADGLWQCGTYWHLATRPDELAALDDEALRQAAPLIDQTLRDCRYQTLVHGDAKLANFCFRPTEETDLGWPRVAAVDFQYVGRGCGMKDVAYFIGSCLDEHECEILAEPLLDDYFELLADQLAQKQTQIDATALEQEWRRLYPFAWADFHRFIKGWSPGHWKINSYSERLTARVIEEVQP